MRVFWEKRNVSFDRANVLVVERNGKRCEKIIYWHIKGFYGVKGAMDFVSCRDEIDVHYQEIKAAVKRGLENTEPEYEVRNYWF